MRCFLVWTGNRALLACILTADLEDELATRPAVLLWPGAIVPIQRVLVGSDSVP